MFLNTDTESMLENELGENSFDLDKDMCLGVAPISDHLLKFGISTYSDENIDLHEDRRDERR